MSLSGTGCLQPSLRLSFLCHCSGVVFLAESPADSPQRSPPPPAPLSPPALPPAPLHSHSRPTDTGCGWLGSSRRWDLLLTSSSCFSFCLASEASASPSFPRSSTISCSSSSSPPPPLGQDKGSASWTSLSLCYSGTKRSSYRSRVQRVPVLILVSHGGLSRFHGDGGQFGVSLLNCLQQKIKEPENHGRERESLPSPSHTHTYKHTPLQTHTHLVSM